MCQLVWHQRHPLLWCSTMVTAIVCCAVEITKHGGVWCFLLLGLVSCGSLPHKAAAQPTGLISAWKGWKYERMERLKKVTALRCLGGQSKKEGIGLHQETGRLCLESQTEYVYGKDWLPKKTHILSSHVNLQFLAFLQNGFNCHQTFFQTFHLCFYPLQKSMSACIL